MLVTFAGAQYPCTRAIRDSGRAVLFLEGGGRAEFAGVKDWSAFALTGGDWEQPDVTAEEQLRADLDYLAAMTGVMLV